MNGFLGSKIFIDENGKKKTRYRCDGDVDVDDDDNVCK